MVYELLYIFSPKFTEEEIKKIHQKNLELLKPYIAKITLEEFWGKKRLAYEIKHFQDGYFILIIFETEPARIKEMDKKLKLQEEILRFLLVKQEYAYIKTRKPLPPKMPRKAGIVAETKEAKTVKAKKPITKSELDKKLDEILGEEIIK